MRFGLQLPSFTFAGVPDAELFERVAETARAAEERRLAEKKRRAVTKRLRGATPEE